MMLISGILFEVINFSCVQVLMFHGRSLFRCLCIVSGQMLAWLAAVWGGMAVLYVLLMPYPHFLPAVSIRHSIIHIGLL